MWLGWFCQNNECTLTRCKGHMWLGWFCQNDKCTLTRRKGHMWLGYVRGWPGWKEVRSRGGGGGSPPPWQWMTTRDSIRPCLQDVCSTVESAGKEISWPGLWRLARGGFGALELRIKPTTPDMMKFNTQMRTPNFEPKKKLSYSYTAKLKPNGHLNFWC